MTSNGIGDGQHRSESFSKLHVLIVGAGIGGLSLAALLAQAGHRVCAVERKSSYDQLSSGGGINVTANALRVLQLIGIQDSLETIGDHVPRIQVKRYATGESISNRETTKPHMMLHRHDLLLALYERALKLGVEVKFEKQLSKLDLSQASPKVYFKDGTMLSSDIVIGADGVNSTMRRNFLPSSELGIVPDSDCVFCIDVPGSVMKSFESTKPLCDLPPYQIWLGPGRSIVAWYMKNREQYHLQLCDHAYRQTGEYAGSSEKGGFVTKVTDMAGLRARWADFDPSIQTIISNTQSCLKWRIATARPLPAWSTHAGRLILLGDAAHAFPPFAGQGAAMAIEDAACLATLIGYARVADDMDAISAVYEKVRRPRVDKIHKIVLSNVAMFSMRDGDKQKERDRKLRESALKEQQAFARKSDSEASDSRLGNWNTPQRGQIIEDYDAVEEARKGWQTYQARL